MYSPKIDESLIPRIYLAAKAAKIPMTTWVNQAVELALPKTNLGAQSLTILEGENSVEFNSAQAPKTRASA
jgi:hypothetical protein